MNQSRYLEGTLAIITLIASVFLFYYAPDLVRGWAFTIPGTTDVALEPVFFPRLASSLTFIASLNLLITIPLRSDNVPASETNLESYMKVGLGLGLILLYLFSIFFIGFITSTIIFIFTMSFVSGYKNWKVILIAAIFVSLILQIIFRYGLHVNLPVGILI
jgi:putative tricarboxylic transport membrane protein